MNASYSNLYANAIRFLSIDSVEQANSGHPGAPMGMADIAEVLWRNHLQHNPKNPHWFNRDRFVLSNGHASMLLYSLLYLTGYDLTIKDLQQFRQWQSKTPGHPEYQHTTGVETTTGPLGQGLGSAVGFALAEKILAAQYNRPNFPIINHYTYAFAGDGCMMEGITHEVCALAGVWKLNKLIVFYDANRISIDGRIDHWMQENVQKRFEAYGWNVIKLQSGHNSAEIDQAISMAKAQSDKPSLLICPTVIGFGSPNKANHADAHGSPLGQEEIKKVRKSLHWDWPPFTVPPEILQDWNATEKGQKHELEWQAIFSAYEEKFPELHAELKRKIEKQLPSVFEQSIAAIEKEFQSYTQPLATRKASQMVLEKIQPVLSELIGGSADLTPSNLTKTKAMQVYSPNNQAANYIHFGVREFGMAAICNGLATYGCFIPYSGTFLVFSDYQRNAIRMSALMQLQTIYIWTHDSIGLGEDGPTHQPIEHLSSLRIIPNLHVWRPADLVETWHAWLHALKRKKGPSGLSLSRQNLPQLGLSLEQREQIQFGAYILYDEGVNPDLIFLASGSEVALCLQAKDLLKKQGKVVRVVSMPCTNLFDEQPKSYQESLLPKQVPVVAVEAAQADHLYKYIRYQGEVLGINQFGASAPAKDLFQHYGFTAENLAKIGLHWCA